MARILERLQAWGVVKAGATHCSGPHAMAAFQEAYAADRIPMSVGRVIRLPLAWVRFGADLPGFRELRRRSRRHAFS